MRLAELFECRRFIEYCRAAKWCARLLRLLALMLPPDSVHGLGHSVRVACVAFNLAEREYGEVDWGVLAEAALLHDVGRQAERQRGVHHAEASAAAARELLSAMGAGVDVEAVARVVAEHSFSAGGRPSSPESCALSDADKLDALGYVGLYRLAYVSGLRGRSLRDAVAHYYEKLRRLPELMCTRAAREAAEEAARVLAKAIAELEAALRAEEEVLTRVAGLG